MLKFNDNIKCVVFDLDGTIYFGSQLAEKANEVINLARSKYQNIFFITNNSAKTRKQIYEKLINLGLDVKIYEVINSAYAVSKYLNDNGYKDVYCIGTKDFASEISSFGINTSSKKPQAVVIGYDINFSLAQIEPILALSSDDYKVIIANQERVYPRDGGTIAPGAGAIVAAVEYTLNKKTDLVIGKPNPMMLEVMIGDWGIKPEEVLVIGDSYDSDVKMADAFGAKSIFIANYDKKEYNCVKVNYLKDILELI